MPVNKYAATAWGKTDKGVDLKCPSGQLCRVSRPGVENLIKLGLLDKLDGLTGLVDQKHIKRVKGGKAPDLDVESLLRDPKSLTAALETMNKIVVHVVLEPQLTLEEDEEKIHIDNVDMDDRAFIFQFATGGTSDLEQFRKQREKVTRSLESK
jgi:hypothetical protein